MASESLTREMSEFPGFTVSTPDTPALTPRGERTRQRLLQGARELLEEVGYREATVTAITRRSGVSLGTFYRYFENREALFLLLLRSLVGVLYDSVTGTWTRDDVAASLRRTTRCYLEAYYENRLLIASMMDMASSVPEAAELWWELRQYTYSRMERHLDGQGAIEEGFDPRLAVAALGGMVEQFAHYWYVQGERYDREPPALDEAADTLGAIWYRACFVEKP